MALYMVKRGYTLHLPQRGNFLKGGEMFTLDPTIENQLLKEQGWKLQRLDNGNGRVSRGAAEAAPEPAFKAAPRDNFASDTLTDGAWAGRRCFIIGGGPSLRDFDFNLLREELTIGVNRAYERLDPTVIFSIDSRFYSWATGGKYGRDAQLAWDHARARKIWLNTHKYEFGPEVQRIPVTKELKDGESIATGMKMVNNSGLGALKLAVTLGANPIYLLGFDLQESGRFQQWWHDGHPMLQRDSVYEEFRQEFETYAPKLAEQGIRVINLNPNSALRCFEFGEMPKMIGVSSDVTVITPTGDRPEAIALLRRWMGKQTVKPRQWIIVDDGRTPLPPISEATVVRREPKPYDPRCTLGENLKAALPLVRHDKVLIMEDDDWYGAEYVETMVALLDDDDLVGLKETNYYHLGVPGIRKMKGQNHASLAKTAFKKSLIPAVLNAIPGDHSIDLRLWKRNKGKLVTADGQSLHVGIKGLPGRPGAGIGHIPKDYTIDGDYHDLKTICPEWETYRNISHILTKLKDRKAERPFVTISILCHNKLEITRVCLESLLQESDCSFEILIADNGSTDGTWKYLTSLKEKRVRAFKQENVGFIRGHNQNLLRAHGEYFIVLNNDVEVETGWLVPLLAPFIDSEVKLTGPFGAKLKKTGQGVATSRDDYDYLEGACLAIPTAFAKEVGLFNELLDFMYSEDADLALRLRAMGHQIRKVQCPIKHVGNVTAKDSPAVDVKGFIIKNNYRLSQKWKNYLETGEFAQEIYIHRNGAQGDVLLLTPLIAQMKKENVHRKIYLSTTCPQLLAGNPDITGIFPPQKRPEKSWVDLDWAYERQPNLHIINAYALAMGLPIPEDRHPLVYFPEISVDVPQDYIVFHAGPTHWPGRQLPVKTLSLVVEILKKQGYRCFEIGPTANLLNADHRYVGRDWQTSAAVIRRALGFIGIDSAPMHIAHAYGKPGAVAFGCIDPALRLDNLHELRPVTVNVGCKFCHHWQEAPRTFSGCLRNDPVCMTRITPEQIVSEFEQAVRNSNGRNLQQPAA